MAPEGPKAAEAAEAAPAAQAPQAAIATLAGPTASGLVACFTAIFGVAGHTALALPAGCCSRLRIAVDGNDERFAATANARR